MITPEERKNDAVTASEMLNTVAGVGKHPSAALTVTGLSILACIAPY